MVSAEVRGQNGLQPRVLLLSPPRIGPLHLFADVFGGAPEKSAQLARHYRTVAEALGCHFLDAALHVQASATDAVHLDAPEQHALGPAIAVEIEQLFA